MINVQKTRLMSKCAIYEKGTGEKDISLSRYFKADFIRLMTIRSILYVTLGFICACALYFQYRLDDFFEAAFVMDYRTLGLRILFIYIVVLILYIAATILYSAFEYSKSRERLGKYYRVLGRILRLNEEVEKVKDLEDYTGVNRSAEENETIN